MGKTALFSRKQAGGAFTFLNQAETTGDTYFVHSGTGTNSVGYGQNPDAPFATIAYAVTQCTAAKGDRVIVMPFHTESVTAAAGISITKSGVSVIGLGNGASRPIITFSTADTADLDVDAASVTLDNLIFRAGFADIAAAIDVNAANCTIRNCQFDAPTTDLNAKIWILGATSTTSNGLVVENCYFYGVDTADTHAISLPGTSDACRIHNNFICGFYETSAIGAAGAVTKIRITNNLIQNLDTDADACINLAANSTGIVAYNGVGAALAGNATTNISCGSGVVLIENYSVDTGDVQGVLDPIAT